MTDTLPSSSAPPPLKRKRKRDRNAPRVRVRLSASNARHLLHYDGRSGLLVWNVDRGHGVRAGDEVGTVRDDGRIALTIDRKTYLAHRVVWLIMTGDWPESRILFRDGDPQNLRWANLMLEADSYSQSYHATYQRQHRQKRRRAIDRGWLDADR
mgnify:FL=1